MRLGDGLRPSHGTYLQSKVTKFHPHLVLRETKPKNKLDSLLGDGKAGLSQVYSLSDEGNAKE